MVDLKSNIVVNIILSYIVYLTKQYNSIERAQIYIWFLICNEHTQKLNYISVATGMLVCHLITHPEDYLYSHTYAVQGTVSVNVFFQFWAIVSLTDTYEQHTASSDSTFMYNSNPD
jgi:hypothetical protein